MANRPQERNPVRCSACTEPAVGHVGQRPYCVVHLGDLGYGVLVIPAYGSGPERVFSARLTASLRGRAADILWPVTPGRVAALPEDSDAAFLRSVGIKPS